MRERGLKQLVDSPDVAYGEFQSVAPACGSVDLTTMSASA